MFLRVPGFLTFSLDIVFGLFLFVHHLRNYLGSFIYLGSSFGTGGLPSPETPQVYGDLLFHLHIDFRLYKRLLYSLLIQWSMRSVERRCILTPQKETFQNRPTPCGPSPVRSTTVTLNVIGLFSGQRDSFNGRVFFFGFL